MPQARRIGAIALVALLASTACRSRANQGGVRAVDDDPEEKAAWIEKAAAAMNCRQSMLLPERVEQLMELPRAAIADKLTQGPAFEATLLDFIAFFTNLPPSTDCGKQAAALADRKRISLNLPNFYLYNKPNMLTAARAVIRGEDFRILFAKEQPLYFFPPFVTAPAPPPPSTTPMPPSTPTPPKTMPEVVAAARDRLLTRIDETRAFFAAEPFDENAACGHFFSPLPKRTSVEAVLRTQLDLASGGYAVLNSTLVKNWVGKLNSLCVLQPTQISAGSGSGTGTDAPSAPPPTYKLVGAEASQVVEIFNKAKANAEKYFAFVGQHTQETEPLTSVADLKTLDPANYFSEKQSPTFFFPYLNFSMFENSSTNFNRHRAAYILRTFFCDDLTPINVVQSDTHAENAHASDKACQACHYKLDPMAGFFRKIGASVSADMTDDAPLTSITFSDGRVYEGEELKSYLDHWKAPAGSTHPLNVGYIRSSTKESANFYGSTVADLYDFMREAPEVRACLTRRLAEYVIGRGQAFDGGWLASLNAKLSTTPGTNAPIDNIRGVIRELLLSNTFSEPDPVRDQCYDRAPGAEPSGLPCDVAFTFSTYCEKCHEGEGARKGFDVSSWIKTADGETFLHLDSDGHQIARKTTLERLKASLESTDVKVRMPYKQDSMPDQERVRVYKWVSALLESSAGG